MGKERLMAKESIPTLAEYNNNPGNLKPPKGVEYEGQLGVDEHGFAIFEKPEYGRKALVNDIRHKLKSGLMTPEDLINKFAPAGDENPEDARDNYKIHLTHNLGLQSSKDEFPEGSEEKIADLITSFETGKPIPQQEKTEGTSASEEQKSPTGGEGKTSKDRVIPPVVGGIAGATAGAMLGHPIALYKSYYDLARSAAGMMPRVEPTMGVEPNIEPTMAAGEPTLSESNASKAVGGKGTYNYAKGFGADDLEARTATGMSKEEIWEDMKKAKAAKAKIAKIAPEMKLDPTLGEYGLYTPQSGGGGARGGPRSTPIAPPTVSEPALASAEDEAARLAARTRPSPVTSALGQVVKNWMIPVRGALAGFGTGFGALDAYNRARAGDTPGSVAAGVGAAASAASPFVPYAGPLSVAIPIGLFARDQMTQMTPEQARQYQKQMGTLGGMFNQQYDPNFAP